MTIPKLTIKRMGKWWWVIGSEEGPVGPYKDREEAKEARDRLHDFYVDYEWEFGDESYGS